MCNVGHLPWCLDRIQIRKQKGRKIFGLSAFLYIRLGLCYVGCRFYNRITNKKTGVSIFRIFLQPPTFLRYRNFNRFSRKIATAHDI